MARGLFSNSDLTGSVQSSLVEAAVDQAENAAAAAEAAAARVEELTEFTGQVVEGEYTVPPSPDNGQTRFLRQDGEWEVPAGGGGGGETYTAGAGLTLTNNEFSVTNIFTSEDETKLDGIEASADVTDTDNVVAALTAGTDISIGSDGTISYTGSGGGGGSSTLAGLTDTNISSPAGGDRLQYDSTNSEWVNAAFNERIENLSNVSISNAADNQYLRYNGTNWINESVDVSHGITAQAPLNLDASDVLTWSAGLSALTDVDSGLNPTDNQILRYDEGNNVWMAETHTLTDIATSGAGITFNGNSIAYNGSLSNNSDVDISNPSDNQFLRYDGTNWVNETVNISGTSLTPVAPIEIDGDDNISFNGGISVLNDVSVSNPADNQFLRHNGSNWVNETVSIPSVLDNLTDVSLSSPADNQFLRHNGSNWVNETVSLVTNINDLGDVALNNATNNQVLQYNGTSWVNQTLTVSTDLDGLSDVNVPNPGDGQVLTWNNSQSMWEAATVSSGGGGATNLNGLSDVSLSTPVDDQFLRYNGTNWVNETVNIPGALDNLSDVTINSPVDNHFLRYNGTTWVNEAVQLGDQNQNAFSNIAVSGQTTLSADTSTDTLNIAEGTGINITTTDSSDTVTIATNLVEGTGIQISGSTISLSGAEFTNADNTKLDNIEAGAQVNQNAFNTFAVAGQSNVVADSATDTVTFVAGSNVTITTDATSDNIRINASGGGATDNSRLGIALSPNSLTVGAAATTITVTLSIQNALSGETISNQSVTVVDPNGHTVAVTGSGNSWSFTAAQASNVAGNYVVTAHADFTVSGTTSPHSQTANLAVSSAGVTNWFTTAAVASVPANISDSAWTDQGVFQDNAHVNLVYDGTGNSYYIAVPTRSGGYQFNATMGGLGEWSNVSDVTPAGFTSGYTVYTIGEINTKNETATSGNTAPVYVMEL